MADKQMSAPPRPAKRDISFSQRTFVRRSVAQGWPCWDREDLNMQNNLEQSSLTAVFAGCAVLSDRRETAWKNHTVSRCTLLELCLADNQTYVNKIHCCAAATIFFAITQIFL
jgi:hypothetical protein